MAIFDFTTQSFYAETYSFVLFRIEAAPALGPGPCAGGLGFWLGPRKNVFTHFVETKIRYFSHVFYRRRGATAAGVNTIGPEGGGREQRW